MPGRAQGYGMPVVVAINRFPHDTLTPSFFTVSSLSRLSLSADLAAKK
jgi:formyltetrahydrofolate synthetase